MTARSLRRRAGRYLRFAHAKKPWMLPGVALSASAALGTALPAILAAFGAR